ncbi:MAG TPA: NTP transferase domain-containing protein, partial [Candidatus Marinimicrobia bacterium]|nr:NTP transferase domain-containing protein [Candidatus Neomarinimicrobiota bacterium]
MKISAIILAAGESTRMGGKNKLLLPYNNGSIITHVCRT